MDVAHSRDMADQLKLADKPFKYIEQPGGDHFLSSGTQRRAFYTAMAEFLNTYLGLKMEGAELAETGARTDDRSTDSTSTESTKIVN